MNSLSNKNSNLGAYTVCLTELWERFGFYTVASLLVLFMTKITRGNKMTAHQLKKNNKKMDEIMTKIREFSHNKSLFAKEVKKAFSHNEIYINPNEEIITKKESDLLLNIYYG